MAANLRVYPDSLDGPDRSERQEPSIRVSFGDLLPILTLAKRYNYLWLQDFLEDEVCITPDLYDVIRAFDTCRRPSA
jgi:hypothetical protein